ncbi:MAG: lamin tail domain-containing protein, partial [Pirellulales bacterium]
MGIRFEPLEQRQLLAGDLVISEFLASNDNGIRDEDRERPDWVEVLNRADVEQNLQGWYLTDDAEELGKWQFPDVALEPGERVVVFASGKDRAEAGAELHTNFKLSSKGEFLALVEPDGQTVAFDFGDAFPPQVADVSYGLPEMVEQLSLHAPGDLGRLLVPRDGSLGATWTAIDLDDASWNELETGIGYGSSFNNVVATNVQSLVKGVNPSAYLRLPFELTDADAISSLSLTVQYNDGFVAYLNGTEIARRNAPAEPDWRSKAPARRGGSASLVPETFDLAERLDLLQTGSNVVAFQALNSDVRSSRFLLVPQLTAVAAGELDIMGRRYFVRPTPADANGEGVSTSIYDVIHSPNVPGEGEPLAVTAQAASSSGAAPLVKLYYKVMFGDETELPMFDDGSHGDGEAGRSGSCRITCRENSPGSWL